MLILASSVLAAPPTTEAVAETLATLDEYGVPWSDNGDGTWSFTSKTRTVGDTKKEGGVVWEYQGQNRIPFAAKPYAGRTRAHQNDGLTDLLDSVMVDGEGGRWVAIDADPELLEQSTVAMRDTSESLEETWWQPLSWDVDTCPSGNDWAMWNDESRNMIGSISTNHDLHRAVVRMVNVVGGACTAVKVGPRAILTNAHCVTMAGAPNVVIPVRSICSRGNSTGYTGADCIDSSGGGLFNFTVTVNGNWASGSDNFSNDYALIEFDFPNITNGPTPNVTRNFDRQTLAGTVAGVPISNRTTSVIEATRAGTYGHPARINGSSCTTTGFGNSAETSFNPGLGGSGLFYEWRTDHWHSSARIKTHFDATAGQSGSPIYQCVGSPMTCSGTTEEIIGLIAGKRGSAPYVGGPRASRFRSWVSINDSTTP